MNLQDGELITTESVLKLMEEKEKIEAELHDLMQILNCNHIGMTEPLVDNEGYPRQDIDVYQVRQARHKIICLKNDYKSLMEEIGKGLFSPLPKITQVDFDSPAYSIGLIVGDLILLLLLFGSINSEKLNRC